MHGTYLGAKVSRMFARWTIESPCRSNPTQYFFILDGTGWSQNTANRRVLVIHSNGSSEVVEIQNDLGLKADDIQGMIERLTKQGVQDIAKIELYG